MRIYMLSIDGLWLLAGLIILSFILVVLTEAVVMFLFKLNSFRKTVVDSLMANIGWSLLVILLILIFNKSAFDQISGLPELIIFYLITSFFEAWLIKFLNTQIGFGKILVASFVMNLLTCGAAYLFLTLDLFF
jgi:hypothetical protein